MQRISVASFLLFLLPVAAHAACPNGVVTVSEWNHFFDGTTADLNGCVIKVKENAPVGNDVNLLPKSDTPLPDTPSGWTPPVPPSTNPTPPPSIPVVTGYKYSAFNPAIFATGAEFVAALNQNQYSWGSCGSNQYTSTGDGTTFQLKQCGTNVSTAGAFYVQNTCPLNYTKSGSTCTIAAGQPTYKPIDHKCSVIRSGNTFSADLYDPDCTTSAIRSEGVTLPGGNAVKSNTSPDLKVTANSDGTTTITLTTINNTNNTTTVSTANYGTDGKQTGRKTEVFTGVGDQQSTTPSAPSTGSGTSINLPTDYNREATQQEIRDALCGGSNQQPCSDVNTQAQSAHSGRLGQIDSLFDQLQQKAQEQTGGVGDAIPYPLDDAFPDQPCINPHFDASDIAPGAYGEVRLCEYANEAQPILRWVAYVFTAVGVFGLWFRKLGGT